MYTQEQMLAMFANTPKFYYQKFGEFTYGVAATTQKVVTEFATEDKPETINTANPGDVILTGLAGEKYVLSYQKFTDRYTPISTTKAQAKGTILACQYQGEDLVFLAPWKQPMNIVSGDWLAFNPDQSEVYRIKESEFYKTYKLS